MNLEKIEIKNFRSIKHLQLEISEINNSKTFCLLGINESGKSSFLNAINLFDDEEINFPLDYYEIDKPVQIIMYYSLNEDDKKNLFKKIKETYKIPESIINEIKFDEVKITASFENETKEKSFFEKINFNKTTFESYTLRDNEVLPKKDVDEETFDLEDFLEENFDTYFFLKSHSVTFWKSSPKYLILEDIDLIEFAESPPKISVPLYNCFKLIELQGEKLKKQITNLKSAVEINNLQSRLSDKVTSHIKTIWPEHPIKLKFQIHDNKISLLIEDEGVLYKAKTANQRSDGFKQFISFLLTLSVQNHKKELSNTILLIDEPETHLHPPAQINLLHELVKITENGNNNLVFFATHSNYMIDKQNIDRCYKVFKTSNELTSLEKIRKRESTYSEVNYEVFNIITNDYHNELYGYLQDISNDKLENLKKDMKWINEKSNKTEDVSLAKYIRNSIHHPENTSNKKYSESELKKSIENLRNLKYS